MQGCLLLVWLLGKGYTNLLLISTSMILVPYLLIGLFLLKLSLRGEGNGLMRAVALVSSGYGLWLLYAAGVEYLLLSPCCSTGRVCCCFSTAAASWGPNCDSAGASGCWPG